MFSAVTNVLLLGFVVYQNESHRKDMKHKDDRLDDLELKFISKNVAEYDSVRGEEPENMNKEVEDPYQPIEEVPLDKLMDAEDNL